MVDCSELKAIPFISKESKYLTHRGIQIKKFELDLLVFEKIILSLKGEKMIRYRKKTFLKKRYFFYLLVATVGLTFCNRSPRHTVQPARGHSHNDYQHERPLFDALDYGFSSIEADIFYVGGELFVAHDSSEIQPDRTLRALYLDPLKELVVQNNGYVLKKHIPLFLLIDIKSEAETTYNALRAMLKEYKEMLTIFDVNGEREGAVTVIVSGNCPKELMQQKIVRYAGCDGRISDLTGTAPPSLFPLISDDWNEHFTWHGRGAIPDVEREKLRSIAETAHRGGHLLRFWAIPEESKPARELLWLELLNSKVDLIGTDDLKGLQQFLTRYENKTKPFVCTPIITPADTMAEIQGSLTVTIAVETKGAEIRCTFDGSEPTEKSTLYQGSFEINKSIVVKARAFKKGYAPSFSAFAIYSIVNHVND